MRQLLEPGNSGRRRRRAMLAMWALGASATLSACRDASRGNEARTAQQAAVDSALARDLTLASAATTPAGSGTLGDTAVAIAQEAPVSRQQNDSPAPIARSETPRRQPAAIRRAETPRSAAVRPQPTPAPAADAPVTATAPATAPAAAPATAEPAPRGTLGAGSLLSGATGSEICSLAHRPGDRFVVSLARAVTGTNGAVLEAGTPVLIELASADERGFAFRLRGVQVRGEFLPADGTVTVSDAVVSERSVSGGNDKGKVITGAVAGAILGRILGGGTKGAVIGAAGGAAAGTAAAQRSRVAERCLAAGATISVTLSAPLVLPGSSP